MTMPGIDGNGDTGTDPADLSNSPDSTTDSVNPAWGDAYNNLAPAIQDMVRPAFQEWDRNQQERFTETNQKLESYKRYDELGDYETLSRYRQVANDLNTDPAAFYQKLGGFLEQQGLLPTATQQPQVDPNAPADPDDFDLKDPRFDQLSDKLSQLDNVIQEQHRKEMIAQEGQLIDQTVAALQQRHAEQFGDNLPFNHKVLFQFVGAQMQAGQQPDLEAAYNDMLAFGQSFQSATPRTVTPYVANPAGGGMPPQEIVDPSKETEQQRRARALQLLGQLTSGE